MSTLAQLRQRVGDRLNFRQSGVVTGVGVKGLVSFIDTQVTDPDDVLRGSWVLFTAGTAGNLGKAFQVAGNRAGEIALRTPLAAAAAASDTYDLYRRFSPYQVRDAINVAIRNAYPELYAKLEIEVAEDVTTLEYQYPRVTSPTPTGVKSGAGSGTTFDYAIISRTIAGDGPLGGLFTADFVTPDATHFITLTWSSIGADQYLVLRRVNAGTWFLFAVLNGSVLTYVDKSQDQPGSVAYTPVTVAPGILDLRQLRRRSNVGLTPPSYVELPGQIWEDLGSSIRIRYRPSAGQFIQFVGVGQQPELVADTDTTTLPDELILAGAGQMLNEELMAGEAASDTDFYEREAKRWAAAYLNAKRRYAYPVIPRERHPPMIRMVPGPAGLMGPINPAP